MLSASALVLINSCMSGSLVSRLSLSGWLPCQVHILLDARLESGSLGVEWCPSTQWHTGQLRRIQKFGSFPLKAENAIGNWNGETSHSKTPAGLGECPKVVEGSTHWHLLLFNFHEHHHHGHHDPHCTVHSLYFTGRLPQDRVSSQWQEHGTQLIKLRDPLLPTLESQSKDRMIRGQSRVWNLGGVRKAHGWNSDFPKTLALTHSIRTVLYLPCPLL